MDSVSSSDESGQIDGGKPEAGGHVPPLGGEAGAARIEPSLGADFGPASSEPRAGSAKADAAASSSALVPFFAVKTDRAAGGESAHRARFDRLLGYGAHAALAVALIAFAWSVGGYMTRSDAPTLAKAGPDAAATAAREQAELQHTTLAMAADIRALKTSLDALRAASAHAPTQEEVRGLEKTIEGLKVRLDAAKAETAAALTQVSGKIDRIQADPAGKLRDVSDRLERVERQSGAPLTTASIAPVPAATVAPAQIPLPPAKTIAKAAGPAAAEAADAGRRPQLIANWVVRDVYDGIALVEGPHGMLEVVTGETIPGVGAVKSIEKRGAGWIVVTSRGMIDSARN